MKESSGQEPMDELELNCIIKDALYKIKRKNVKRKLFGKLGFVIETEDKLMCYVKKEKCRIEKSRNGYHIYHIDCTAPSQKYKELVEKYNLDKQIVYVLDGLTFNRDEIADIKGDKNCKIQIKNCKFNFTFSIATLGNCTLRNTIIAPIARTLIYIGAENLIMHNTSIMPRYDAVAGVFIRLKAENSIEIKHSKVGPERNLEETGLDVVSNSINICNSTLKVRYISIEAETLQTKNSLVTANESTKLEVEKFNELNITSPLIEYNNKLLKYEGTTTCLKQININLDINRQALLSQLRGLKADLGKYKETIVEQVVRNIDKEPVGRMLAKARRKQEHGKKD